MQTIEHNIKYVHPIMYEMDRMYAELSIADFKQDGLFGNPYDESFKGIVELFEKFGKIKSTFDYSDKHITAMKLPKYATKNIIVCASGGKDSLATVLHYMKMGYNVTLFHTAGINRGYYGEEQCVRQLADKLGLPLYVETVKLRGDKCWIDHPMKNMIIANLALSYGIENKITTKVAFGNFTTDYLTDTNFTYAGDDCPEMWKAYESIIGKIIPKFRMYISSINNTTTFNALKNHIDLLPYTVSCVTPYRFRNQFKGRIEKKYGLTLTEHRCGSCWKCAVEYIRFVDMGVFELNKEYYEHCIVVLFNTIRKETGIKYLFTVDVWNTYMVYSIKKSKLPDLNKSVIRNQRIKYSKPKIVY